MNYANKQELYEFIITGASGSAPNDGFIDNITYPQRIAIDNISWPAGTIGLSKARANFRWQRLAMDLVGLGITVTSVETPGATSITSATSLRIQAIVPSWVRTLDENNPGTELFGPVAVERVIARVLTNVLTQRIEWIDGSTGGTTGVTSKGPTLTIETIGYVYATLNAAESAISYSVKGYV